MNSTHTDGGSNVLDDEAGDTRGLVERQVGRGHGNELRAHVTARHRGRVHGERVQIAVLIWKGGRVNAREKAGSLCWFQKFHPYCEHLTQGTHLIMTRRHPKSRMTSGKNFSQHAHTSEEDDARSFGSRGNWPLGSNSISLSMQRATGFS